jgi:glycosyltransferase involved in cell wall biosynthesis
MRIILFVGSMNCGGAERVASTLVNAWAQRGDHVSLVVTYSGRGDCFYDLHPEVKLTYLADCVPNDARGLTGQFKRLLAARRLIRAHRADVVVSFLTHVNFRAIIAAAFSGVPVIACEHTDPAADSRPLGWRIAARLLYPFASSVTLLTHSIEKAFRRSVPFARTHVMPNPLPDALLSCARPVAVTSGRRRLLACGSLNTHKQFDKLIDAFSRISDDVPDWDLWIWGEGPQRAMLESRIDTLKLADRVKMPGASATLWNEMNRGEALVLSSHHEGLPMVLMEGMAIGLACVSFDCPSGPRELIDDGIDGLLVAPDDVGALANSLRRVLLDPALRESLGEASRRSVRERYSIQHILARWDALFGSVNVGSTT